MDRSTILCNFLKLANRDPNKIKDYMREYMRNRYHSVRNRVLKELGGKCIQCGSKKDLQFDHINRHKKTLRMADIHSVSDARLKEELKNIQILCKKCHKQKSHNAWDFAVPKSKHGTYWMYRKYNCRCPKCVKAYKEKHKEWRKNILATIQNSIIKMADDFLYHETQPENLADIINEGLMPMSYGQSFVGNMGEMLSPDLFDEAELENFPQEDFAQRTYVDLTEPKASRYGDILLRFPKQSLQRDVDWYTTNIIPPEVIEIKVSGNWLPLIRYKD